MQKTIGTSILALILSAGAVSAQEYSMTLASTGQTSTPLYDAAVDFAEAVAERTEGRVKIEPVFGGVFGGDRETAELTQLGEIEMFWSSDIGFGTLIPELGFATLPYMFPGNEAADEYYIGGFVGEAFEDVMLSNGMRVLGWGENEYRHLTTSGRPVREVADLAGLKLRVPQFPSLLSFFEKLGASPTPMAFTEVFTALQQGTIDGQDNGPILTASQRFHEAQDYFTYTYHVYSASPLAINEDYFASLPEDIREILLEEGARAAAAQLVANRAEGERAMEVMREAGIEIHELTPEAQAEFRQTALEVWDDFATQYDPEIMARIISELQSN